MNIYLLGATGSIGTQVLEVIRGNNYKVKSISVGKNIDRTIEIIEEFKPEFVSCLYEEDMINLQSKYPNIKFGYGDKGLIEAATYSIEDGFLINAVVGVAGLIPTIEAIKKGRNILLANKETLVVGGEIVTKLAKENNVKLFPIDSEHSAIFQCLQGHRKEDVNRIIITASGGTFRDKTRDQLKNVTVEEALKHPNWSMGKKITIDSATMVNKGLEVIEAHYLFDIDYDHIETIIHKESIIHSMVEYKDKTVIAQLSVPDMKIPIQYALTYPRKLDINQFETLNLLELKTLSFEEMNFERFPLLKLAYHVGKTGGLLPAVYNASNEVAVDLFLRGKISFLEIEDIIFETVGKTNNKLNPTIFDIIEMDKVVREQILQKYDS